MKISQIFAGCGICLALVANSLAGSAAALLQPPPPSVDQTSSAQGEDPIPASEYEVYQAFFTSIPKGGIDQPQFFDDAARARILVSVTIVPRTPPAPDWPKGALGKIDPEMVADYLAKNRQEWPLRNRIGVERMELITPAELDKRLRGNTIMYRVGPKFEGVLPMINSSYAKVSRVGFNAAGDAAMLSVGLNFPGTMGARYLVLMRKISGKWTIAAVAQESMWIS